MAVKNIGNIKLSSAGGIGTLAWKSDYPITTYTLTPKTDTGVWDGFKIPPDSGITMLCSGFRFENSQKEKLTVTDTLITIEIPETKSSLTAEVILNIYDEKGNRYFANIVQAGATKIFTYPLGLIKFNSEGGTISNIITSNSGLTSSRVFSSGGETYYYNSAPPVDWGSIKLEKITDDKITWVSKYRLTATCNLKNDSTTSSKRLPGSITMQSGLVGAWPILSYEISPKQPNYYFSLNKNNVTFGSNGGIDTSVTIDTNYPNFTNSTLPSWITNFSYRSGEGIRSINIQTIPNDTINSRTTSIEFKNGEKILETLVITQQGKELYFEVEPTSISAPKEGGLYTVTVKTNVQYKMEIRGNTTNSGEAWFTVSQPNTTIKDIPYSVIIAPNKSSKGFTGSIVFTPTGMPAKTVQISISGDTPYIKYTPSYTEIDENYHTWEVVREHNIPEIVEKENLVGLSYTIKSSNDTLSEYPKITTYVISANKNESSSDRSSYLETSGDNIYSRYSIVQRSKSVFDILDYDNKTPIREINFPAEGATAIIIVRHNVAWSSINGDQSWIYFNNYNYSKPSSTIDFQSPITVSKNTGEDRENTIIFKDSKGETITLKIHQAGGIEPSIKVTPNYLSLDNNEHNIVLTIDASHDWNLSQEPGYDIPNWISLNKVEGAPGITEIVISIKQALLKKRAAILKFKLKNYELFDTTTIVQSAIENGYDITDVEDDTEWGNRMESKIRDKYLKVRIRYTGNDLAVITALKTLYETSYA